MNKNYILDNAWVTGHVLAMEYTGNEYTELDDSFDEYSKSAKNAKDENAFQGIGKTVSWVKVRDGSKIYEPHRHFVKKLCEKIDAHFGKVYG